MNTEKTDQLSGDTNPYHGYTLLEGDLVVSGFSAVTGGYQASAEYEIYLKDKNLSTTDFDIPIVDAVHIINYGSGVYQYRQAPYIYLAPATGIVSNQATVLITKQLITGNTYQAILSLTYFTSSISSGDRDSAFYTQYFKFKLRSDSWPGGI